MQGRPSRKQTRHMREVTNILNFLRPGNVSKTAQVTVSNKANSESRPNKNNMRKKMTDQK